MIDALPGDIFHRGQVLNNTYEIEGVLGRGGTGEVYRARNLISGRIVAIKALNAQFSGQDGYIELMKREEQMRDIRDDAVVRYTECSRMDQGHVFLVMDYIAGPSIADEMLRRRLEPRELMIIAHRVAEGLVAAHKQGIVHRDLSPDNIILRDGSPEKATIIDFGIAKDTGEGARTIVGNDFAGKYEYAAPEQMEGRAEPKSDLYALGALLLAAWKGQVPFSGMTPGEMIRRKQERLETGGVPEPLKGLIDWLTEPSLSQRAPSAAAVVDQVGKALKGSTTERGRTAPPTKVTTRMDDRSPKRSRGGIWALALAVLLALAGGGAWFGGILQPVIQTLTEEPLPVAAPYTLTAASAGGPGTQTLKTYAPDAAAAEAIRAGFAAVAGQPAAEGAVTIAQGMPAPSWAPGAADVFAAARGLEDWKIELSDMTAKVSGLAPTVAAGTTIRAALEAWAAKHGFALKLDLANGPRVLDPQAVQDVLDGMANCGPLLQIEPPVDGYPLGTTITIEGAALVPDFDVTIGTALAGVIGDREVVTSIELLNQNLCTVRSVLPPLPSNALSIWLGHGDTGEANLVGVFTTGQNPVVEVLVPANVTKGRLWVMVVDTTNTVYNLLPNANFAETDISKLGTVEGGTRRVRVLFSVAENKADNRLPKAEVTPSDYGKSEIIAFLTEGDLFDTRRPADESIGSFSESLAATLDERPGNIIGFASRILETRP